MAKPKIGEYGYNPYDTSPEIAAPVAGTPPVNPYNPTTPYGGRPLGYGSNAGQTGDPWTQSLQAYNAGDTNQTYQAGYTNPQGTYTPPAITLNDNRGTGTTPTDTPYSVDTALTDLGTAATDNPAPPAPNLGAPENTDKVLTPYGDLVNLPKLSYVSPYTKDYWNEARTTFQNNLQASTQPALDKALAGSREQSIRLGGASSGLIQAGQQPILESYGRDFTQQMGGFEQKALDAQISESKDAAIWENTQNKDIRDFYSTQQLDKGSWDRLQKSDQEINRITNLYKNNEISREEAWAGYKVASDERLRVLDTARQDILLKLSIAEKEKDWEKNADLQEKLANINAESQRQMADSQEKAGLWGALGSIVGAATGVGLTKLFK
jgi:hypothetical protein